MRTLIEFPAFVPKQLQKQRLPRLAWPRNRVNVRSLICKCRYNPDESSQHSCFCLLLEQSEAVPRLEDLLLLLLLLMQLNEVRLNSEERRRGRSGKCFFSRETDIAYLANLSIFTGITKLSCPVLVPRTSTTTTQQNKQAKKQRSRQTWASAAADYMQFIGMDALSRGWKVSARYFFQFVDVSEGIPGSFI